jgi:hypothetical protein
MAENLLTRWREIDRQIEQDIEIAMGRRFSPFLNLEHVIRAMEEVPAAYATALHILKSPPPPPPADQPD